MLPEYLHQNNKQYFLVMSDHHLETEEYHFFGFHIQSLFLIIHKY